MPRHESRGVDVPHLALFGDESTLFDVAGKLFVALLVRSSLALRKTPQIPKLDTEKWDTPAKSGPVKAHEHVDVHSKKKKKKKRKTRKTGSEKRASLHLLPKLVLLVRLSPTHLHFRIKVPAVEIFATFCSDTYIRRG